MPDVLHRTTKQLIPSIAQAELPEPATNYIISPDLSAVVGVPSRYWTITGDTVTPMSQAERDAVDAQILSANRDESIGELDDLEAVLRAFAQVVMDEINILRGQHSLPARNLSQLRTAIRNKMGT